MGPGELHRERFCACMSSSCCSSLQAEISFEYNYTTPSRIRAGLLLGRCHAALGEHDLAVAAFATSLQLAETCRLQLCELLAVSGRAAAGRAAGGNGSHWGLEEGRQRLGEVLGRMALGEDGKQRAALETQLLR